MIYYYVAVAQNTADKTVSETFYRGVYACICIRKYFTIFSIYGSDTSLCVF